MITFVLIQGLIEHCDEIISLVAQQFYRATADCFRELSYRLNHGRGLVHRVVLKAAL